MDLKLLSQTVLTLISLLNTAIKEQKLEHEQWVLDYEDKLNELSVEF